MTPLRRKMTEEFQVRHYAAGPRRAASSAWPGSRSTSVNPLAQKRKSGQQVLDWPQRRTLFKKRRGPPSNRNVSLKYSAPDAALGVTVWANGWAR